MKFLISLYFKINFKWELSESTRDFENLYKILIESENFILYHVPTCTGANLEK